MKKDNQILFSMLALLIIFSYTGCKKDNLNPDSLYTPDSTNVTATASLKDLQDGRALYISNCGQCHNYYSPDNYSPSQWDGILAQMAPRTGLSSAQRTLIEKYLRKGK